MNNTLSLHWLDKNWQHRGYANNVHLIIDFDNKVYRQLVNFGIPSFNCNRIEVMRKSDIDDYINYLDTMDFEKTDDEILR